MESHDQASPFAVLRGLADQADFVHRFVLRHPEVSVAGEREEVIERLRPTHLAHVREMGFKAEEWCIAGQVHGAEVGVVDEPLATPWEGVDGFVSRSSDVVLGIYVADCCAVYLVDSETGIFGLVHSGRKGSEQGITGNAIRAMRGLGSRVEDIRVVLSPCIRPPAYEVDFAKLIVADCLKAGVSADQVHDEEVCTSSDLSRYYSYRIEKGQTGRMLALLGRRGGACA